MRSRRLSCVVGSVVLCAGLALPAGAVAEAPQAPPSTQKPRPKPPPKAPPKTAPKAAGPVAAKEPPPPPPKPGLTMRTAYTGPDGQITETKLVSDGTRQRVEIGEGVSVITQCDTKQILQINDKAKLYVAVPLEALPAPAATEPPKKTGVVTYTTAFTDSGEKKDMFGLSARRVTTVVARTPTPASCDKKKERTRTDGWYAPVPVTLACAPAAALAPPAAECRDEPQATTTGEPPTGSPLAYSLTTYGDDGKETGVARMEVKELTVAPVDATLLEAPAGYTRTATSAEFVAAVERAANEARWGAPKAAGVVRIGVLMPKNKTSEDVSAEAIGDELLQSLSVAPYDAVPILATTPDEQAAEAKGKEVDYLVALDLTTLKTSAPGKVGGLLRKASGGGSPTELHEAKVEYRLFAGGSATPKTAKSASAKTGGFTLRQAIGLARLAARIYLGASTGMMGMMLSQNGLGAGMGAGIGIPTASADPSMNALSVVFNILGQAAVAPADEKSREATVVSALRSASSDILKELGAKKDK